MKPTAYTGRKTVVLGSIVRVNQKVIRRMNDCDMNRKAALA